MATRLEKLMFWISVKDDASGPVGKLQKALRSTSRLSKQAWGQLAGGAMTAAGAGRALEGMVSPALDLNRALPVPTGAGQEKGFFSFPEPGAPAVVGFA